MITPDGRRLMNNVLANRDAKIATHIALGINTVYDTTDDGEDPPTTHNRFHSPYIVDEVPIANVGIVDGSPDIIVFSGQATASKYYIANNIGLVSKRFSGEVDSQSTVVSVASSSWNVPENPIEYSTNVFTEDGYLLLDTSNNIRIYKDQVSLGGKTADDLLAFPFTLHQIDDPTGVSITLRIRYRDAGGTEYLSELTRTIVADLGGYMIDGDNSNNVVTELTDSGNANPFLWQARLKDFSDYQSLLAYGGRIYEIQIEVNGLPGGGIVAYGSIKFTPETLSNFYRITTGYRRLLKTLFKTSKQAYVNAEYRIYGV